MGAAYLDGKGWGGGVEKWHVLDCRFQAAGFNHLLVRDRFWGAYGFAAQGFWVMVWRLA